MDAVGKLAQVLDSAEEFIVVRNISGHLKNHHTLSLTWSDETLSRRYCPEDEIKDIFNKLTDNVTGEISIKVDDEFYPPINVDQGSYMLDGLCQPMPTTPVVPIEGDGKSGKYNISK